MLGFPKVPIPFCHLYQTPRRFIFFYPVKDPIWPAAQGGLRKVRRRKVEDCNITRLFCRDSTETENLRPNLLVDPGKIEDI